jgi:hypothetical protein
VSDTPRTDRARLDEHDPAVAVAIECSKLERELNAANDRIKRLEEALDKTSKAACKHIKQLESEVYALRLYGNKDCTAMADQALKEAKL